jgi:prevent-host-death family protein
MKYSEFIKPISYFKSHAAKVIRDVADHKKTMIITQNGEAKAILQDVQSYEELQDSLALLKILASSSQKLQQGKMKPLEKSFRDIRAKINSKNI